MKSILFIFLLIFVNYGNASCLDSERLTGVNLAGAEFNSGTLPGTLFKNYVYPSSSVLTYFKNKNINLIRLPIRWERIQPSAYSNLDSTNLKQITAVASYAKSNNICLLIDIHNYAKYYGIALSDYSDAEDMLYDLYTKLLTNLSDYTDYVAIGFMNEPAYVTRQYWAEISQNLVNRLRVASIQNLIFVAGGGWSGAHSWFSYSSTDPSNANLFTDFTDPLNRLVIEMHQYADSNYSGTKSDCISADKMNTFLNNVSTWASNTNHHIFLGEFGLSQDTTCLAVLSSMVQTMNAYPWTGWTYWAGGAWWSSTYVFSIQPSSAGEDKPQMGVIGSYLGK